MPRGSPGQRCAHGRAGAKSRYHPAVRRLRRVLGGRAERDVCPAAGRHSDREDDRLVQLRAAFLDRPQGEVLADAALADQERPRARLVGVLGLCGPPYLTSAREIMSRTGTKTARTVNKYLDNLVAAGWLSIERPADGTLVFTPAVPESCVRDCPDDERW